MKFLTKVLSVLLTVVMLLTVLPLGAFAAEPKTAEGLPTEIIGTGADGTFTVTIGVDRLKAIATSGATDASAILDQLKTLVEANGSTISVEELMKLIPMENLMELLLGEHNENVPAMIEQLGGKDAVLAMLDPESLLLSIEGEELVDLIAFISALSGITSAINAKEILGLDITVNYNKILTDYVNQTELNDRIGNLTFEQVKSVLVDQTAAAAMSPAEVYDTVTNNLGVATVVDATALIDLLLGAEEDITALLNEDAPEAMINDSETLDLEEVFDKILVAVNGGRDLDEFINFANLLDLLTPADFGTLFNLVDRNLVINQLKPHAITIAKTLNKAQLTSVATLLFSSLLENVNRIVVDGYVVASEDETGLLTVNEKNLMYAIYSVLPTLAELENLGDDGLIASFNVVADYVTADGTATEVRKDVDFRFVCESGHEYIRRAARVLDRYVDVERNGNQIAIEIDVPAIITRAYNKALTTGDSARLEKVRQLALKMETMTGSELLEVLDNTTFEEIVDLIDDVDVTALYTRLFNTGIVQTALDKAEELTGYRYDLSSLSDLDAMLDAVAAGKLPSFEQIADKISAKINVDVMAVLEKVATVADENAYVQKLLDKAATLPYIGKYAEGVDATEILNTYKGMDPVEAVSAFICARTGKDLMQALENYSVNELYAKAVDFANAHGESYYNRAKSLVLNLADPNYVPTNSKVLFLQSLIPSGLLQRFLNGSIVGFYNGEGKFSATKTDFTIDFGRIVNKAFAVAKNYVNINPTIESFARTLLPESTVTFGLSVKVNFQNLALVNFLDQDGEKFASTFLPVGINPEVVKAPAEEGMTFAGWVDAGGNVVTAVTGDSTLKASYEVNLKPVVSFYYYNGETTVELRAIELIGRNTLTAAEIPSIDAPAGLEADEYALVWYDADGNPITVDEILAGVYEEDTAFTAAYSFKVDFYSTQDGVNFNLLESKMVKIGEIAQIPAYELPATMTIGTYALTYFNGKTISASALTTKAIVESATVFAPVAYTLSYLPSESFMTVVGNAVIVVDGTDWSVVIDSDAIDLTMDATHALFASATSVTVISNKITMTLGEQMLELLKNTATAEIHLTGEKKTAALNFKGGYYEGTVNEYYSFDLVIDGTTRPESFASDFEITVSYANVLEATDEKRTSVFVLDASGKVTEVLETVVSAAKETVTFNPPHFTDYAVMNEYLLTASFKKGIAAYVGTVKLNGEELAAAGNFIPEGATVTKVVPVPSSSADYVKTITVNATELNMNGSFAMPSAATQLEVEVAGMTFSDYYVLPDGRAFADIASASNALKTATAPAGYTFKKNGTEYVFDGEPATVSDVYHNVVLDVKTYTVNFYEENGTTKIASRTFTVETKGEFTPPEVPEKVGMIGTWAAYDLDEIIAGSSTTKTVKASYEARKYNVTYKNGTVVQVAYGTKVDATANFTLPAGYEISKALYRTPTSVTELDGTTFTMVAFDVTVDLVLVPKNVTFVIREANTTQGETVTAKFGEAVAFNVELTKLDVLTQAPAGGTLVGFVSNADGSKVLTYSIVVDESFLSGNKVVTYNVTKDVRPVVNFYNGKDVKNAEMTLKKGLVFDSFEMGENGDGVFASEIFTFAIFHSAPASLLWLWILLAVLLFALIVAVFYTLYICGKLKPNFILRFFAWLVSGFFALCLAVSAVGLWIQHRFGKHDSDFEANGFEEPKN